MCNCKIMISEYKKEKWINYGRWVQPTLSGCFWSHWSATSSVKEVSQGKIFEPIVFLDGNTLMSVLDKNKMQSIIEDVVTNNKIEEYTNIVEKTGKKYEKRHLDLLLSKNLDTREYFQELFESYQEMVGIWWFFIPFADELEKYIIENKLIDSSEKLLEKVESIRKKTWLEEQVLEVQNIAQQIKQHLPGVSVGDITEETIKQKEELYNTVKNHIKKFVWSGTHHWMGDGYNMEAFIEQVNEALKKEKKEEQRNPDNNPLWNLLATISYWRTHCAEATSKVVFESRDRLIEAADLLSITYNELSYLSNREIIEALSKNSFIFSENYQERKKGYGCIVDNKENEQIIIGEDLDSWLKKLTETQVEQVSEFKGSVGCKGGIIKGRVKVVISPDDFSKFEKGDILIANETSPDFIPLMKIASAVITDIGGITSHAAIISRELNIPCIIGTKIGTKVLKDGDEVEIDANNGIIKILNKSK